MAARSHGRPAPRSSASPPWRPVSEGGSCDTQRCRSASGWRSAECCCSWRIAVSTMPVCQLLRRCCFCTACGVHAHLGAKTLNNKSDTTGALLQDCRKLTVAPKIVLETMAKDPRRLRDQGGFTLIDILFVVG